MNNKRGGEKLISKVGEVMLYVNDQDKAVKFWTKNVGFKQLADETNEVGMRWIEIAPKTDSATSIILFNKGFIAKMSPELNLGTQSIMFFTNNLEALHSHLKENNVQVGEITVMSNEKVFNFADNEENYFAVMEEK